jgi:hypothetical protein
VASAKDTTTLTVARVNLKVALDNSADIKDVCHATKASDLQNALKWISSLDFRTSQQADQKQPLAGTGQFAIAPGLCHYINDCRTARGACSNG